ncbi:MAG TPA: hypothetical protein VEA69_06515 [Tepidisphaeraceae bacterium]|nr:hypothetical protein [Tepidisphaeraceae bacterium]
MPSPTPGISGDSTRVRVRRGGSVGGKSTNPPALGAVVGASAGGPAQVRDARGTIAIAGLMSLQV